MQGVEDTLTDMAGFPGYKTRPQGRVRTWPNSWQLKLILTAGH